MARKFNGTSDAIDFGLIALLNPANNAQIAVSIWANHSSIPASSIDADMIGKGFDGTSTSYEMKINGTGPTVFFQSFLSGAGHGASFVTTPTTGIWYHYYGDYDGATWHLYINGLLKASSTDAVGPQHNVIQSTIGALFTGSMQNFFPGTLAHAAIWSKALTAPEVKLLALGRSPLLVRPGNLLVYRPLAIGMLGLDLGPFNLGSGTITGTTFASDPPFTMIRSIDLMSGTLMQPPIPMQAPPPAILMAQIVF